MTAQICQSIVMSRGSETLPDRSLPMKIAKKPERTIRVHRAICTREILMSFLSLMKIPDHLFVILRPTRPPMKMKIASVTIQVIHVGQEGGIRNPQKIIQRIAIMNPIAVGVFHVFIEFSSSSRESQSALSAIIHPCPGTLKSDMIR
jgi:hypothetical protein